MSLRRASYHLHTALIVDPQGAQSAAAVLDFVRRFDDFLDHCDHEPRLAFGVIQNGARFLERYLSLRPEHFERLEAVGEAKKLVTAPFYLSPQGDSILSPELFIRNLLLGRQTVQVFARPLEICWLPFKLRLPAYVPQLVHGFGMRTLILPMPTEGSAEGRWRGDEGSEICVGWALSNAESGESIAALRAHFAPLNQSGEMLILCPWDSGGALAFSQMSAARQVVDEVFSSHPGHYGRALETYARRCDLPLLTLEPYVGAASPQITAAEHLLTHHLEPASIVAAYGALPAFLPHPQRMLQQLWRGLISASVAPERMEAEASLEAIYETASALGVERSEWLSAVIKSDHPDFVISAAKLPESGMGLIVRGVNMGTASIWVRLRPFRRFERALVLRHDESPTGGTMGLEAEGAIRFLAEPARFLTFGFG